MLRRLVLVVALGAGLLALGWTHLTHRIDAPVASATMTALPDPPTESELWPGTSTWAEAVLDTLTLEEKIAQLEFCTVHADMR